jgi:dienelactone hydrolase
MDKKLLLSPTEHHNYVMDHTAQKLAYSGGDVTEWQKKLRRKLRELIGFMPEKPNKLNVKTLWKKEHELGTIEKITFRSEPGADVMGYICLPKNAKPPYPLMVCLQGHSTGMHNSIGYDRETETEKIKIDGDRDYALGCMKRGFAALCIEQRSFGLRREQKQKVVSPHGCHDAVLHALFLGRTLLGERVFDVDCGLDYLARRGDIDLKKIGIMGNSTGGTVAIYCAALLPRISYAMPSCSFCTYRGSIMAYYHCSDHYVPGLYNYAEMGDVMGLFAPKPVVIVTGSEDEGFPLGEVKKAFTSLKKIYRAAGAEKHCHLIVGQGGHRFYAAESWPKMLAEISR